MRATIAAMADALAARGYAVLCPDIYHRTPYAPFDTSTLFGDAAEFARLPHRASHGDACPNNLLRNPSGRGFTLIDFGFWRPQPVGFDLSQLLVGDIQIGRRDAADLPELAEASANPEGEGEGEDEGEEEAPKAGARKTKKG